MKKLFSLMTAMILCIGAIHAADTKIYCKVAQAWWNADGAAVAAYAWSGEGESAEKNAEWPGVRMEAVEGQDDLWSIDLDLTRYKKIIFVRVNGEGDIADWGAKTADLDFPEDGMDLYTVTSESAVWGDPGVAGEWSKFTAQEPDPEPKPEVLYYIAGSMTDWETNMIPSTSLRYTLKLKAGDHQLKVLTLDKEWKGYEDLSVKPEGVSGDKDGNICFTLAEDGNVIVSYSEDAFVIDGNFYIKPAEEAKIEIAGSWNKDEADQWILNAMSISEDKAVATYDVELKAGDYEFKLIKDNKWVTKANDGQPYGLHRDWAGVAGVTDDATENLKLKADVDGKYIFTFTLANDSLGIKFPDKPVDPEAAKFYVTGDSAFVVDALAGLDKKWAPDAIKTTDYRLTLTLKGGQDYKMKVTLDGTWNTAKGYSELSNPAKGLSTDADNNICFKLEGEGPQDIVIEYGEDAVFNVAGKFYVEPVDPEAPKFYIAGTMTDWEKNKIAVNEDQYLLDLKAGDHKLKIIVGENWIGYKKLSVVTKGLSTDEDDNICFTLAEAGKVKVTYNGADFIVDGNFYVKPDEPEAAKFYITGSKELVGEEKAWKADAIAVSADSYTFEKLPVGDYKLKITLKGAWEPASDVLGFDALTEVAEGLSKDEDGNICFTLAEESDVKVSYFMADGKQVFKLEGKFYTEPGVVSFYITGDSAFVVDAGLSADKQWAPNAIPVIDDDNMVFKLKGNQDYKVKITLDGTWETAKNFNDLTEVWKGVKDVDGENHNIGFKLTEDADVMIKYNEHDFKLESKKFYEESVEPQTAKFYITGSKELVGEEKAWKADAIAVSEDSYTFEKLPAGDYKLKITLKGAWEPASDVLGFDALTEVAEGLSKDEDGNICFTLAEASDVTVTYGLGGAGSVVFKLEGNFYVEPVVIDAKFYITGDAALVGNEKAWKPNAIAVSEDSYTFKALAVGEYKMKITIDGTWATAKGYDDLTNPDENIKKDGDGNIVFYLAEAGDVTVTYAEGVLTLDGKFGEKAVEPDVKFYIAGSMTDWATNKIAVKDDRYLLNLEAGDYKLKVITIAEEWKGYDDLTEKPEGVTKDADGNICFTLAEAGQVILMYTSDIFTLSGNFYVKPEDELSVSAKGAWDEWGLELNFEVSEDKKSAVLNIPLLKGEYEFKLIVNGDWRSNGYTFHRESVGAAGITENAEANMVLNADVDGEYTITWTFENDSLGIVFPKKDEPIIDKVILYVVLHIDWEKVFAYAWSEEGEKNAEWPGVELKKFIAGEKPVPSRVRAALQAEDEVVYMYECPKELANVIFNNGIVGEGAEQTSDLTWEEEKPVFVIDSEKNDQGKYDGEWTAETPTDLNIVTDDTKAVKVLYNGDLYILRAGKVYNFQGQLVK
ncbi:MAG: starch-binding protein [Paludibacteraceae bacterium]|nr:starch-binding protein [Paludibacteraceae bacterium]